MCRPDGNPGFDTATGRFEFWSWGYNHWGVDPMPYHIEPKDSPVSTPEKFQEYPLIATSGGRSYEFFHSENRQLFEGIFGDLNKVAGSENDLFYLAEQLKASGKPLPKMYQWCGTEDFLYEENVKMRDHLRNLGYDLTYEESPGDHQWKYWDEKIQTVLNWLPIRK